jgi:hypothetical protein
MDTNTEISRTEISRIQDRILKTRIVNTRIAREYVNPSDATIEAWEADWARRESEDAE